MRALFVHAGGFCLVTGRAFGTAETLAGMGILRAFVLVLAVGACTQPARAASSIVGAGDVAVRSLRFVPGAGGGPGMAPSGGTILVATLDLTNDSPRTFTPDVSRFILTSGDGERYQGTDSGSSAFVGVANSRAPLKAGDARTYTVGFRTPDPVATGTIGYEP